jgi:hypothetical protein
VQRHSVFTTPSRTTFSSTALSITVKTRHSTKHNSNQHSSKNNSKIMQYTITHNSNIKCCSSVSYFYSCSDCFHAECHYSDWPGRYQQYKRHLKLQNWSSKIMQYTILRTAILNAALNVVFFIVVLTVFMRNVIILSVVCMMWWGHLLN